MRSARLKPVPYDARHIDVAAQAARECGHSSLKAILRLGYEVRIVRMADGISGTRVRVYFGTGGYRAPVVEALASGFEPACLDAHAQLLAQREAERAVSA